jgi:hypothetical protein
MKTQYLGRFIPNLKSEIGCLFSTTYKPPKVCDRRPMRGMVYTDRKAKALMGLA